MRMRSTLVLLAVVALLGGLLWWTDQKPSDVGNLSVRVLGGHTLDRAVKIRWQMKGLAPIEIRREPGGPFRLTEPVDDLASISQLRSIAQTWDSAEMADQQVPDDESNRKRFGLDDPRMKVEVVFEDGAAQKFELGSEGRLGGDVYVRRDGRIYSGGLGLWSSLQVGIDDLRERTVFCTGDAMIFGVKIDQKMGEGRTLLEVRRKDEEWSLLAPVKARADPQAARSFVMSLLGLHIDQFPPAVVRFDDRPPDLEVRLDTSSGEYVVPMWQDPQRNLIGKLRDRKISFVVSASQAAGVFDVAAEKLRARVLFPVSSIHTEALALIVDPGAANGPRIVLQRNSVEEPWLLAEPVRSPAEATPVQKLLAAINSLRALQFYPGGAADPRYGLANGSLQVGVQALGQKQPALVRFGSNARDGEFDITYACRVDTPDEVVGVPQEPARMVRAPWTDYVTLDVVKLGQPVQRLDLARAQAPVRTLQRKDAGWVVVGGGAASDDLGDIVDELRDLHGKRALSIKAEGLAAPDWTLALCRDNGDVFVKIEVWDRTGKPLIVRTEARPELGFELSVLHSDQLRKLWQ